MRRHQPTEVYLLRRRLRIARRNKLDRAPLGIFRKRRPLGCLRSGCQLCHFEKIHGLPTRAERWADLRLREGIWDLDVFTID